MPWGSHLSTCPHGGTQAADLQLLEVKRHAAGKLAETRSKSLELSEVSEKSGYSRPSQEGMLEALLRASEM